MRATNTVPAHIRVSLVLTVNRAYPATSVSESESESTASGASASDDKTATVQYKPATSLASNNNALAHYEQSRGYDQIHMHYISNIHGCTGTP